MLAMSENNATNREPDLPAILEAAGRGDEAAWRTIIDLYSRRVYALARSRLGALRHELAEEITQSVFVTVASKIGPQPDGDTGSSGYTERGRFESWLFRVAMNRIRDEVRRSRRSPGTLENGEASFIPGRGQEDDDAHDAPARLARLREAIAMLSEADRQVVELRHHAGMSFKSMAELLEEPIGTLLARHHRALKKLKDLMSGPGHTGPRLEHGVRP
jgi:RNA polymerase sigma-70 factor, ECF subfamily